MFEVTWREITRSGEIVLRRKAFKTEVARDKFIEKLFEKDNFYELYGIR